MYVGMSECLNSRTAGQILMRLGTEVMPLGVPRISQLLISYSQN